jgi:GNAT superfamily N-acetyltransferase
MIRVLQPSKEDFSTLFQEFEKDSQFVKIDPVYAAKTYKNLIETGRGQVFLLCKEDGEVQGALGCIKGPDLHNGEMVAVETFWYVLPEYRGDFGSIQLFLAFEKWAKDQGCVRKAMIHMIDSHPKQLQRLYERRGYKLIEQHYEKEV